LKLRSHSDLHRDYSQGKWKFVIAIHCRIIKMRQVTQGMTTGKVHLMRRLPFSLLLLVVFPAFAAHAADQGTQADPTTAVYKIRALGGGHVADGSAVLIAPGRLLTACHVTRRAESIRVGREELKWFAYPVTSDIEHDLCVLAVSELSAATPATIGPTEQLRLSDPVTAAGYPRGGKLNVSHGEIKGLHALDGASVLQVSAPFDHGQSGGGLFDAAGRLIGIIGFKAVAGGNFHYALPLAWAGDALPGQAAGPPVLRLQEQAFWQRPNAQKPLFLLAASLEANQDWKALQGVAREWVTEDVNNPASWLCLGRMLTRLKHDQAAARAFAQAATLLLSPARQPDPSTPMVRVDYVAYGSVRPSRPAMQ
jgi:S1-C subfamily serine protease